MLIMYFFIRKFYFISGVSMFEGLLTISLEKQGAEETKFKNAFRVLFTFSLNLIDFPVSL